MSRKTFILVGLFVGSAIGGFIPELWGDGGISFSALILSTIGALAGIWITWKMSEGMGL